MDKIVKKKDSLVTSKAKIYGWVDEQINLNLQIHIAMKNKQHLVAISFDLEKVYDLETFYFKVYNNIISRDIFFTLLKTLTNRRVKLKAHGH